MTLRRSLRTATKALTAQWGHFAPRLFIQLGYIDKDLLESIDIEAQKRREEEKERGPRTDPSDGASEPITSGKREAKPTVESQEARAARKAVKECQKTLWRLQLSASGGCVLYRLRLRSGVCVFICVAF